MPEKQSDPNLPNDAFPDEMALLSDTFPTLGIEPSLCPLTPMEDEENGLSGQKWDR